MIACNKFWFWQNRPFVRSPPHVSGCEMSCRAAIFFSWNLQKNKMITIWQKVIKYLLNKFTFQGGRSVLLKGESLHLFLPRPSAMIYNVDYFWIIMHQLSVGMGHSLSMSWERWVKRVYNSVILGAEESGHEWFSDESWEHRILLRDSIQQAQTLSSWLMSRFEELKLRASEVSQHCKLQALEPWFVGAFLLPFFFVWY